MNEEKLKIAFARVKRDHQELANNLIHVNSKINDLSRMAILSDEIKEKIRKLDTINLEKFILNLENEFKSINNLTKDFNDRFLEASGFIKSFSTELEKYNFELVDLKKEMNKTRNKEANSRLDIKVLNDRFIELQELLSEKVEIETKSLRMEFTEELAKVYDAIHEKIKKRKSKSPSKKKPELQNNTTKNMDAERIPEKPETKNPKKGDGKIKKAVKWLFIDDENEEMSSIKQEVKRF